MKNKFGIFLLTFLLAISAIVKAQDHQFIKVEEVLLGENIDLDTNIKG